MPAHLSVCRPSPTTAYFTVSNAPARSTISAKLAFYVQNVLRLFVFFAIIVIDVAKVRAIIAQSGLVEWNELWTSTVGGAVCRLADQYSWHVLAAVSAVVLYLVSVKGYTEESLLVLRGLGIQVTTSSPTYWSTATTRFIPTTQVQDIIIHEAFKGFEVKFYLAILVDGEPDVTVVFPNLLPKRAILEEVWRGARQCLYEPKS